MSTATINEFVHPALLYRDSDEYLAVTVPFIREGLDAGEPIAVAVPTANLDLLREALGAHVDRVLMRDMTEAARNPGRIIPTVLLAFANAHPGQRVRIIGEPIWAGRTATEYPACAQHEALINAAFTGRRATILCPYNTDLLDPAWVRDAHTTHPVMYDTTHRWDSPHYAGPIAAAASFNQPLPEPPAGAATATVDFDSIPTVRRFVTDQANRAGLAADRVADLTIAVSELSSNSVQHGGGTGQLAMWTDPEHLICQLTDEGHVTNPLAGRIPVSETTIGGRGLLLVHQLCDLVRVHTDSAGTTTRIYLHR